MPKYLRYLSTAIAVITIAALLLTNMAFAAGTAQWPNTTSPAPITLTTGYSRSVGTQTSDGYFIIASIQSSQLYLNKLDASGTKLWNGGSPLLVPSSTSNAFFEVVADAAGGAFILQQGPSGTIRDMQVSRVDANGNFLWRSYQFDSVERADYGGRILHDGNNGAYVTWYTIVGGIRTSYITRLGSDGLACEVATCGQAWNSSGSGTFRPVAMPTTGTKAPEPQMVLASNGIVFPYMTNSGLDIVKLNKDGSNAWGVAGTYTRIADTANYHMMAAGNGADGVLLAYFSSSYQIKFSAVDSAGVITVGNASTGITIKTAASGTNSIAGADDGNGYLYYAWTERIGVEDDVYVQKFNSSGVEQWTAGGVVAGALADGYDDYMGVNYFDNLPRNLEPDGSGGAIVSLMRMGGTINAAIVGQRIKSDGTLDWGEGYIVTADTTNDTDDEPNVISDGAGGAVFSFLHNSNTTIAQYVKSDPAPVDPCPALGPNQQCGTLTLTGTTDIFFNGYDPEGGANFTTVYFQDASSSVATSETSLNITADAWSADQLVGIIDLEQGNTWTLQVRGPATFSGTGTNSFTPTLVEAATSIHEFDSGSFSLSLIDSNNSIFPMSKDSSAGTEANNLLFWTSGGSGYTWANGHITAPMNTADAVTWDSSVFTYSIATDENILVNSTDNGEVGIFGTGINFNVGIPGGTGADTYTGTITYTLI